MWTSTDGRSIWHVASAATFLGKSAGFALTRDQKLWKLIRVPEISASNVDNSLPRRESEPTFVIESRRFEQGPFFDAILYGLEKLK
jgi:hypothetical protein